MNLDIILRIHDGKNIHGDKPRCINVPKKELIIGCLSSLINSANLTKNVNISFIVLNDHCTEDCISRVYKIFEYSKYPYKIINLKVPGFHYSGLKQFEYCKNSTADLVYSVEDDYLHCAEAISEMLFSYEYIKSYYDFEKDLCIFPFDNPEDYEQKNIFFGMNLKTPIRHWRQGIWTTFTMMTKPKVFREHWNIFKKLASEYTPWNGIDLIGHQLVHEGNTISNIWKYHVIRISPIPSLALHVQFEKQKDCIINYLGWWYKYSKIKSYKITYD
jgi:hypothetical protein